MTTALSWLNDLAQWLARWVPRLVLIEADTSRCPLRTSRWRARGRARPGRVLADHARGDELEPFGVVVERLDFTQNGTGVALKNLTDWNYSDRASGTRPD